MTLTPEDLLAISNLMDVKISSALQSELQPIKDDIRDIKAELQPIKDDIKNIKAELHTMREDIDDLKYRMTKVELHLENVTDKNIRLLAENYLPAAKRYEKASAQIDAMQADIEIMKNVIGHHSELLHKLA